MAVKLPLASGVVSNVEPTSFLARRRLKITTPIAARATRPMMIKFRFLDFMEKTLPVVCFEKYILMKGW
jgi:hypothetical protein